MAPLVHEQGSLSAGVTSLGGTEDENKPATGVVGMRSQVERRAGTRIQSREELAGWKKGQKGWSVARTQVSTMRSPASLGRTGRWSQIKQGAGGTARSLRFILNASQKPCHLIGICESPL